MTGRRFAWAAAALGAAALVAAATPGLGAGSRPPAVRFAKPVFVDGSLAGGEPTVFYDARHQDYIYTAHEGTTHTLHDGVVEAPGEDVAWGANYRNQVNIWTSRDGRHWSVVNLDGTGFTSNPTTNTGFSDPDLTQDAGGRVYDTGIDLVNDALFSSADGGRTWDRGTVNCHEGDRPWLAGAHRNEVFLATDPTYSANGHTVYRSTDGGASCGSFGIGDFGTDYTGYGKLVYNPRNGALVEPAIFSNPDGFGVSILPHASRAFARQHGAFHPIRLARTDGALSLFPVVALDRRGDIVVTWADNPGGKGRNSIWLAMLSPGGRVLVRPHVIAHPGTTVLWPWVTAGDRGDAAVVWYQYDRVVPNPDQATAGRLFVYEETFLGLGGRHPRHVTVNASGRPIHSGGVCQSGTTCVATGQDRRLGDYFTDNLDGRGCVIIATGDTTRPDPVTGAQRAWSLPLFIHQDAGPSLTGRSCGTTRHRTHAGALLGRAPEGPLPTAALGALVLAAGLAGLVRTRPPAVGVPALS